MLPEHPLSARETAVSAGMPRSRQHRPAGRRWSGTTRPARDRQTARVTADHADHPAVRDLAQQVKTVLADRHRVVVGLAGPPGTGKSTVAALLVAHLRERGTSTALVPMDGFHLDQRELERLGRADRKGAPDTFDPAGFVALLRRLRDANEPVVSGRGSTGSSSSRSAARSPSCRRSGRRHRGELPAAAHADLAGTPASDDVSLGAWKEVRDHLDRCWFVAIDPAVRLERLVARHVAHGRTPEAAREWVGRTDEVNARLVDSTRSRADGVLPWD